MADYWIKLYQEVLDDPKMATLPDRLWRRTIEIFLLAGRLSKDKSGVLPETRQLAWMLRMNSDDLQSDLMQMATTGIIESIPNGWFVAKFNKRQSSSSNSERVKEFRERRHREQYYDNVTQMKRNVTQINRLTDNRLTEAETDTDTETEASGSGNKPTSNIFSIYEHEIGPLTPIIGDELKAAEQEYPVDWITAALQTASRNNKRSWAYAHAILKRWKVEGFQSVNKHDKSPGGNGRKSTLDKSLEAIKEFMAVEDGKQN